MLIYTNEGNPATLKLLIAAKYAKINVSTKIVKPNDLLLEHPNHLPYLEVNHDTTIFIPNAALWYLLQPPDEIAATVTEWLEWEACILSPTLAHLFGGGSKSESLKSRLTNALTKLNKMVENKAFITGTSLNIDDIAIWSTIYPLYLDINSRDQYLSKNVNIISWIKSIEAFPEIQEVLGNFKVICGAYQALHSAVMYPALPTLTTQQNDAILTVPLQDNVTEEELQSAKAAWTKDSSQIPKLKTRDTVILPSTSEKNILITSALPYVNNVPHLGNIIGCVLSADVFARFCRICNYNVLYIGGTDEYGTATETKALEEGLSCQAICDKYYAIHKDIYEWFNISFDYFGRSSAPEQTELCQSLFLQLNGNGFTFTDAVEQLHCANCKRYLADRFVEGGCPHPGCTYEDARGDQCDGCGKLVNATELKNPRCKICGNTPKVTTSKQFFIDLPKLEPLLLHWMKKSSPGWSNNAQVIAKSWIKDGLKPRCITRDLKWGVPVPLNDFKDKVFYVWFDAPIGYISITKAYTEKWEEWWKPVKNYNINLYQFMAKDNVPFHSVMFPSCLLGINAGFTTVSHIMATEYLNYEDGKFSKSRGVGVFGNDARETGISSDVWRFYLLYVRPESQDSNFSWIDLATKNNSELLNNLGNFVNRALVFAKNNFKNSIPEVVPNLADFTFLALCTRELKGYIACLEKAKLRDGIRHILAISRLGNQYMQVNQPWVLLKGSDHDKVRAGTVIGLCCNIACLLGTLIHPYLPTTSTTLKKQLNSPDFALAPENIEITQILPTGHKLNEPSPLFTKLEPAYVEELKQKFAGQTKENSGVNGVIEKSISDITKLEEEIAKQGLIVRKLKEGGANKSEWQPEVTKLLELKNKLKSFVGTPGEAQKTKKKK